jgi:hypothetical protein
MRRHAEIGAQVDVEIVRLQCEGYSRTLWVNVDGWSGVADR